MTSIRVLLADDHTLVRAGIRSLLEKVPDVTVVGEASDGREVLNMAMAQRPDVVLMDIAMSGLNGLEATARLRKDLPEVRVLVLSMHANEEYVTQALRAGASGYLLKKSATLELGRAIQSVARSEIFLCADIPQRLRDLSDKSETAQPALLDQLTPRQREVLQLVAEGETNKSIASRLSLSVKTVEAHRTQLMKQLNIHDIAGLVRFAVRLGLVSTDT